MDDFLGFKPPAWQSGPQRPSDKPLIPPPGGARRFVRWDHPAAADLGSAGSPPGPQVAVGVLAGQPARLHTGGGGLRGSHALRTLSKPFPLEVPIHTPQGGRCEGNPDLRSFFPPAGFPLRVQGRAFALLGHRLIHGISSSAHPARFPSMFLPLICLHMKFSAKDS